MKIFVYGTLLKGMSRCGVLDNSQFTGHGFTEGVLFDSGAYPAIRMGNSTVYGELYKIDKEKISELDRIEGYYPEDKERSLYIRKEVNVILLNDGSMEKAYAYFFNHTLTDDEQITCGDYRRYTVEKKSDMQWYIAYGSNMSSGRLKERIGEVYEIKTGYLNGYRLIFNKKADDIRAYANIAYIGSGYRCPFAAYCINKEQLYKLDRYEGEPSHYIRIGLAFSDMAGESSYIGHIYIANTKKLTQNRSPSSNYLKYIYDGYQEHGFDTSCLPKLQI